MPRVCAGALGLSSHELSSSPREDAEERLRRTEPMSTNLCRVVHSPEVTQSTGKSSWQEGLSHKESEEKGQDGVTRTGLKWGSAVWQQRHVTRGVSAMAW